MLEQRYGALAGVSYLENIAAHRNMSEAESQELLTLQNQIQNLDEQLEDLAEERSLRLEGLEQRKEDLIKELKAQSRATFRAIEQEMKTQREKALSSRKAALAVLIERRDAGLSELVSI